MRDGPPRLVLYGIGQYGQFITKLAVARGWPIVAAYNRAGAKVGQDVGLLAGLDRPLGVIVQDCDTADYANLSADIGIVTATDRLEQNLAGYARLMGAGLDVLCHGSEAYFPFGCQPALAERIDAMAKANGVTFTGGGIWDVSRIWAALLVAGPCSDLTALHHKSTTDVQRTGKGLMLATGVGMTANEFEEKMVKVPGRMGNLYVTILQQVLYGLGLTVTHSSERREAIVSDSPTWCRLLEKELAPGVALGTRLIAEARTAEGITAEANIELRIFADDEVEYMAWTLDGMPRSRIRIEREDSGHFTASSLFNRIPDVIAAPPGIMPVCSLGPMKPQLNLAKRARA